MVSLFYRGRVCSVQIIEKVVNRDRSFFLTKCARFFQAKIRPGGLMLQTLSTGGNVREPVQRFVIGPEHLPAIWHQHFDTFTPYVDLLFLQDR